MTYIVLVFSCFLVVGLTRGQSIYQQLKITTPKSPYSAGTSALHRTLIISSKVVIPSPDGPHYNCSEGTDIGTPPQCRPTPEYWDTCIKDNPCGRHSQCDVTTNGTRTCSCVFGFEGRAPNCLPGAEHGYCDGDDPCGSNAECSPVQRQCYCLPGYVGTPPNCTAGAVLVALCDPFPCGGYANCREQDGAPVCSCLPGCVGEPPQCTPGPELWRVCFEDAACGQHSQCSMRDRVAVCSPCAVGFHGEPPYCMQPFNTTVGR